MTCQGGSSRLAVIGSPRSFWRLPAPLPLPELPSSRLLSVARSRARRARYAR
jgi:hypothetical protein